MPRAWKGQSRGVSRFSNGSDDAKSFRQAKRVVRGMHLCVIIKVDVHIAAGGVLPSTDARGPVVELAVAIAAHVQLGGTVQPNVKKVRRQDFGVAERPGRIGDDQRTPVRPQEIIELVAEIRRVTHLERVPIRHSPSIHGVDESIAPETMIVLACDRFSLGGIARQHAHEIMEALGLEMVGRGQLPEEGTRLPTERQHATGEEIPQRVFAVAQLQIVGDEAAALEGEHEVTTGDFLRPPLEDLW